jgi:D-alanyl-D-alanine carboxypeptidase-like protein
VGRQGQDIPFNNLMPREIVDIFARHGFIWGGKRRHYDTMHFESRPDFPESESAC